MYLGEVTTYLLDFLEWFVSFRWFGLFLVGEFFFVRFVCVYSLVSSSPFCFGWLVYVHFFLSSSISFLCILSIYFKA